MERVIVYIYFLCWGGWCWAGTRAAYSNCHDPCKNHEGVAMSDEKRLIKDLLFEYEKVGKVGRPVFNTTDTIRVSYGLALIQILDLDEKNQVLTTNVWSRYSWKDILLAWAPKDYGGVNDVRIPVDKIWTPDIVLYNYADTRLKEQREAMAVVSFEGSVLWIPMAIFKSTCSIDITHFPFDEQTCHMKFGSWTYDGFRVDIDFYDGLEQVDVNDYIPSNEWKLVSAPARKNVKYYPCCEEPYPDLTFTMTLRRIAAFYNYILILPCVLLSSLTLVIFWLPPESPAKMILGMNIFVAFFLLLLLLADSTPPAASSVPLIGAYFCLNMILITLSTFLSVIVINLYFRGDKKSRVPSWLKRIIVHGLGRLMCMRQIDPNIDGPPQEHQRSKGGENSTTSCVSEHNHSKKSRRKKEKCPEMRYNKFQPPPVLDYRDGVTTCTTPQMSERLSSGFHNQSLENDIREIRRGIRSLMGRLHDKDAQGKVAQEWRMIARVLDRMFFFIYLTTIIVSLATIFPKG